MIDLYAGLVARVGYHTPGSPVGTTLTVGIDLTPRYEHPSGVYVEGIAGIYYKHVFTNLAIYRATEDGIRQVRDFGRPHIAAGIGLGAGYNLSRTTRVPVRFYARADMGLQYAPSLSFAMLNLLPTTSLIAGVQYAHGGNE